MYRNSIYTKYKIGLLLLVSILIQSCNSNLEANKELLIFKNYFDALTSKSDRKWEYTKDTVKVWFDTKDNEPSLRIKNKKSNSKWKEWDKIMNSKIEYDTIWYDKEENTINGYFYEMNDFYELIGKPATKTQRTYWLDESKKIKEVLI